MSVYVDIPNWTFGRMKMCHMIADTHSELISMAKLINLDEKHIQYSGTPKEHFDVCKSKRDLAIKNGAIVCSTRDMLQKIKKKREVGFE